MSKPLVDRIPFAKIAIVLAIAFALALGLCGVTLVLRSSSLNTSHEEFGGGPFLDATAWLEMGVMALSGVGLVITTVVWAALAAVGSSQSEAPEPQKLFDQQEETKFDKKG